MLAHLPSYKYLMSYLFIDKDNNKDRISLGY